LLQITLPYNYLQLLYCCALHSYVSDSSFALALAIPNWLGGDALLPGQVFSKSRDSAVLPYAFLTFVYAFLAFGSTGTTFFLNLRLTCSKGARTSATLCCHKSMMLD
jgi:hypothetical protein